jgi:hypothetical protein
MEIVPTFLLVYRAWGIVRSKNFVSGPSVRGGGSLLAKCRSPVVGPHRLEELCIGRIFGAWLPSQRAC